MEGLEGKRIVVFYDDGSAVSRKDGFCTANTDSEIILDNKLLIPKSRIVRVEVKNG